MDSISTLNALKAVQAGLSQSAPAAAQTVMLFNADGTPAGKYPAQQLVQDLAKAGSAYGTCSTAAATAAKEVAISDFILLKNGTVSILFQSAITVTGATLNVSSTGAKAIKVNGNALQPGLVKKDTVVTMTFDGTAWNITGMFGLEQTATPTNHLVDMGLPSGLLWADSNIDLSQEDGFAASPYQYSCTFFSWGNTTGQNPNSSGGFDETWGTANDGEPYASSPGAKLTGSAAGSQDFVRANLGAPWRLPTVPEQQELFANITFVDADDNEITGSDKCTTVNNCYGIMLKSNNNGNHLFFPGSGGGHGTSWDNRGSIGYYWSSSWYDAQVGGGLYFSSVGVNLTSPWSYRYLGLAGRPVQ